jgi:hypothetical protein
MAALLLAGGALVGGEILSGGADKKAFESQATGTRSQIETEKLAQAFKEREFGKQIERQTPFVEAGKLALPDLIAAISNRPNAVPNETSLVDSRISPNIDRSIDPRINKTVPGVLPAERAQSQSITDFIGPNAPKFIRDKALLDLEAVELEKNKGRLSDLVDLGVGGVGKGAQSRMNIGSSAGGSAVKTGNLLADSLQNQATQRQESRDRLISGISGLPALAAASDDFNILDYIGV